MTNDENKIWNDAIDACANGLRKDGWNDAYTSVNCRDTCMRLANYLDGKKRAFSAERVPTPTQNPRRYLGKWVKYGDGHCQLLTSVHPEGNYWFNGPQENINADDIDNLVSIHRMHIATRPEDLP